MKKAPTLEAIAAVEARLAVSRQKTRDGLHRARAAFRARLKRPSTIAVAAGVAGAAGLAGLAGVWFARRRRPRQRRRIYPKLGAGVALTAYIVPFVQSLLSRYAKEALSLLAEHLRTAWRTRAESAADASNAAMQDLPPIGVPR